MPAIIDKSGNVEVTCDTCGKPITHSNEYGMFCEDNCGLSESKQIKDVMLGTGGKPGLLDKMFDKFDDDDVEGEDVAGLLDRMMGEDVLAELVQLGKLFGDKK